ncbi:BRO-N domain-containing protein, partial [Streptococcus dysgalactiae]
MQEIFNFKGQEVRTVTINNEPYFSNSDVCRILEINNPSQALKRLKADGVISNEVIDSLGRKQKMKFVSESNLYKLIFQSKKQEAEAFTDWVTSEVLPAIRKHGAYVTDYKAVDLLTNPNALGNFLQGLTEQVKRLETKIEKDKPKVLFADAV